MCNILESNLSVGGESSVVELHSKRNRLHLNDAGKIFPSIHQRMLKETLLNISFTDCHKLSQVSVALMGGSHLLSSQ